MFKGEYVPLTKRRFYVPCREDECIKLYELLKDRIPMVSQVTVEITDKGLIVEAFGYETDIKDLWFEIKRTVGPLREITRRSGLRRYSVSLISRIINKTFPPRLLVEVLKKQLYNVEYSGEEDTIVTNADFNEIVRLADKLADLNNIASRLTSNTSTRYYIAAGSVLTGLDLEDLVRASLELGLLREVGEEKYALTLDWRVALDILLKNVKK